MAVGLLQVEVALQVDAVVLLQRVVGDLQVPLQLQSLFGDLIKQIHFNELSDADDCGLKAPLPVG